jgi:hypothetical protein
MAGECDTWRNELLRSSRKHKSHPGVLHAGEPLLVQNDKKKKPQGATAVDVGTLLPTAKSLVAAPANMSPLSEPEI